MQPKRKINFKNFIITSSITTIIIIMFLFVNWQLNSYKNFYYENLYFFAKVSAVNISSYINSSPKKRLFSTFIYKEYTLKDYKMYENSDVFVITDTYITDIKSKNIQKFTTNYSNEKDLSKFIDNILNAFLSMEIIDKVLVVDKNGYVSYVSLNYKRNFTGLIQKDFETNLIHNIVPELSQQAIQENYLTNNLYKISKKSQNDLYTKYSIVIDINNWGNLIIFYNQDYLYNIKQVYKKKVMKISIILLILGLIINFRFYYRNIK